MKLIYLLSVFFTSLIYSTFSVAAGDNLTIKVDPDSIDPKMQSVVYHISPGNLSIASYRQGNPSHFKVTLCRACNEKIYQLSPTVELSYNEQALTSSDLALLVMKKEYRHITLAINRKEQSIDYLIFSDIKKSELNPLTTINDEPLGSEQP